VVQVMFYAIFLGFSLLPAVLYRYLRYHRIIPNRHSENIAVSWIKLLFVAAVTALIMMTVMILVADFPD